jgi:methionine synthase II (cobalamin-independent)
MTDLAPVVATGIGSWPGLDMLEALKITFAECPDLPYLPELPARGAYAGMIGRAVGLLSGLGVDLQPAGWRLTEGSSREHWQARSTLRSDLDQLEEYAQGYAGRCKLAFAGPWTLAAMIERPRGDRVLADHGARRELGQSLSEGLSELIADVHGRLPDIELVIQLDEPMLPPVLAGSVPTASGFSRHRAVDGQQVSETFSYLIDQVASTGVAAQMAVHCCASGVPIELLHRAGFSVLFLDLDQLSGADWDSIAERVEHGLLLGAGALPTRQTMTPEQVAARVLGPIRERGLDPALAAQLMVTPACGLAGHTQGSALRALRTVSKAAEIVTDQLADG